MASRVSAFIEIGGEISADQYPTLCSLIAAEDLSTDWDGDVFEPHHHKPGEALSLFAHEVSNGEFPALETWCQANGLIYGRWSDARPGEWDAHRVVYQGSGEPLSYPADEGGGIVMNEGQAKALGSMEAILGFFASGNFLIPALIVKQPEGEKRAALLPGRSED